MSKDKIRISPKINTFADVTKSLQDIEKIVNKLIDSSSSEAEKELLETEGETGDIQITQNTDKSYSFEVRTEEGWKTPVIGNSAIKFKDKPSSISKNQEKSIDEIEAEDISTGDSQANLTTFDEKANKFILARPDYDSGWVDMTNTDTTGTHDLGSVPILGIWQISNDSGTTVQFERIHDDNDNSVLNVTSSAWGIYGNGDYGYWANGGSSFTAINYTGFKARVLLWK